MTEYYRGIPKRKKINQTPNSVIWVTDNPEYASEYGVVYELDIDDNNCASISDVYEIAEEYDYTEDSELMDIVEDKDVQKELLKHGYTMADCGESSSGDYIYVVLDSSIIKSSNLYKEMFDESSCIKEMCESSGIEYEKEMSEQNLSDWDKFVSMIGQRHLIGNKLMYYSADGKIINITPLGNVYITQKNNLKRRAFSDVKSFDEIYRVLKEKNLLPETVEPKEKSFEEKLNALFENAGLKNNESFSLPKTVPVKFFKITDNLNDVEKWRVKILQNNSPENKRLGSFDLVGYIMVSLVDNTIIPIARSDEHQRGYEILETIYMDEYDIIPNNYYPIFCLGNNYPYNQDEALKIKVALEKLKSYGYDLDKLNVSMYYLSKGKDERYISGNDFLNEIETKETERKKIPVSSLGKKLVKAFEDISSACEYRNVRGELSLPKIRNAWFELYNIGHKIQLNNDGDMLISSFDDENVERLIEKYDDGYISKENFMNLFFGFGGIRQKIHNLLRRYHSSEILNNELGNVDEVVNMIGAI